MDTSEAEKLLKRAWDRVFANEQRVGFDGLSRSEQVFSVIWALEAEVNNGGFSQYMFNSAGDQAALAPGALREVGAGGVAEVCERFYALLPGGAPARTQDERQAQLDAVAASLGEEQFEQVSAELEQRFHALEDDLRVRMVDYSRANGLTTRDHVVRRLLRWLRGTREHSRPSGTWEDGGPSETPFEVPSGWQGATFPVTDALGADLSRPHPEGRAVVRQLQREGETALGVWDSGTGKLVRLLPHAADARWTPDGQHLVSVDGALVATVYEWPALSTRARAQLEFDTGRGVGGVNLTISGSGRLGAAQVYSGQSEEGYVLFSLPDLVTLATLPYVAGESASPCVFSPDEDHLAFVVEPDACWWAGGGEEADWDTPARGGPVQWAVLHVQETRPPGVRGEHPVLVDLPAGWLPSGDLAGASWPRNLRFAGAGRVVFDVPWGGTCSIPFPPEGPCFAPPPNR